MEETLELNDGQIVVKYDNKTFEITELSDWNGNEVSYYWEKVAKEAVEELKP